MTPSMLGQLHGDFRGELICPEDPRYDRARAVWNARIDRRPALLARCTGVADVIAALAFARAQGLAIAIRGGGHDIAGNGVCEGGLVIDLSPMKGIRVDRRRRTVRAQAGVTWGELDRETQAFGLATPGGQCSSTGVVGVMLGGGLGWLMKKHGLTIDNLLSADVVTVDGHLVTASAEENRELFWALRGGGGNFGVVTEIELRLHPLTQVTAGVLLHPPERLGDALRFFRDFTAQEPDALTTCLFNVSVSPAPPGVPEALHDRQLVAIATCWSGSPEQADAAIGPLRAFGPPLVDTITQMPYCAFQSMFDGAESDHPKYKKHQRSAYLNALSDAGIEALVGHARSAPSRLSALLLFSLGGAVTRVDADATAFSGRGARFLAVAQAVWDGPEEADRNVEWSRTCGQTLRSLSHGRTYPNYVDADEPRGRVRDAYGEAGYARLAAVKRTYDPTNLLRMNKNVEP